MEVFADSFVEFVRDIAANFDNHEARIKALEDGAKCDIDDCIVCGGPSPPCFTQVDLDAACEAKVKAERERCVGIVQQQREVWVGENYPRRVKSCEDIAGAIEAGD